MCICVGGQRAITVAKKSSYQTEKLIGLHNLEIQYKSAKLPLVGPVVNIAY